MKVVSICLLVCLAGLLIWPALSVAADSLGQEPTVPLRLSATHWIHTGVIALTAMIVATVLGVSMAMWTVHARAGWLRGVLLLLGASPLVVPMYLHGMASWQVAVGLGFYHELLGEGPWSDLLVVGLVHGLRLSALIHLAVVAGWQTLDGRWLEAGMLVGSRRWVHLRITLPLLMPFIALGALLVAIISVSDVSVPLLFQVHTVLALQLWDAHYRALDPASTWRAVIPPLVVTVAAVAILLPPLWRRAAPLLTAKRDPASIPRGRSIGFALAGVFSLVLINVPMTHLLRQVTDLSILVETFRANLPLIAASVEVTLGGAVLALLMGWALLAPTQSGRLGMAVVLGALILFAIPGFLWAAAAVSWWNQPGWRGWAFDTGAVRWLILGARLVAIPLLVVGLALARIDAKQRQAGLLAGLRMGIYTHIVWPQIRRAVWVAYALCAMAVVSDLDAAIMLDLPGRTTLVVGLCNRLHISPRSPEVAMMAVVILTTCVGLLLLPVVVSKATRWLRVLP